MRETLQIKTLYELSEYESLLPLIDSFKHFIKDKKTVQKVTIRWIHFIERLVKIRLRGKKDGISELIKEIRNEKLFTSYWLREKAEELENIYGNKNKQMA